METAGAESYRFPENPRQGARADQPSGTTKLICATQEREAAKSLFLTAEGLPTALATTISTTVSTSSKVAVTTDEPRPAASTVKAGRLMSKEDADKVKQAIAKATSVEEIKRLERSLREGYMPSLDAVGA